MFTYIYNNQAYTADTIEELQALLTAAGCQDDVKELLNAMYDNLDEQQEAANIYKDEQQEAIDAYENDQQEMFNEKTIED